MFKVFCVLRAPWGKPRPYFYEMFPNTTVTCNSLGYKNIQVARGFKLNLDYHRYTAVPRCTASEVPKYGW